MIRVAVVAPALALRAGLRALLSAPPAAAWAGISTTLPTGGPETIEVVHEAAGLAAEEPLPAEVDILVIAAEPPPLEDLRRAAQARPGRLGLLLLAEEPQAIQGLASLPWRAWGLLTLDATAEELAAAVRALAEGLWVGDPALVLPSLPRFLSDPEGGEAQPAEALTEREAEVLQLLARGLANKQIAATLRISEHTVKFHVSSIYAKLGVTNRTEAVRRGVQNGLVLL